MDANKLAKLGNAGYSRSIEPAERIREWKGHIVGFDTEYTSKTHELISFQLWSGDRGVFVPVPKGKKLTPLWIYHECVKLCGVQDKFLLIVYFSLAELQFLPVVAEGFNIREYGSGSIDVCFDAKGCMLDIFDLQRWFASPNQPLKKAAASFGHKKLDFDTANMTRKRGLSKKGRRYALNDARIQHDIFCDLRKLFLDNAGVDPVIARTPASASATALRRRTRRKLFCDSNPARLLAMRGTWGGHAEVFARGKLKGNYTEWDFKSAYPTSALRLGEMPVQGSWRCFRTLREARKMRGGFVRVTFRFPSSTMYPCLPVHVKRADCMLYPREGESYCTLEELRYAAEIGCTFRIIEGRGYRKGTRLLSDYLQWTLDERAKSSGGARHMWKLLGNALIGKFAQCISKIPLGALIELSEKLDLYLDEVLQLSAEEQRNLFDIAGMKCPEHVSVGPIFMPEWNGLITGYTRAALAQLILTGEAVYCHTDSAWTKSKPQCDMLPFAKKTSGPVTIIRTRFASMGRNLTYERAKDELVHIAHHSVWNMSAAIEMLKKWDGLRDIVHQYEITRPLKLRESIKSRRRVGIWVTEKRKADTQWDCKRQLLDDGTTVPWNDAEVYLDAVKASGYK